MKAKTRETSLSNEVVAICFKHLDFQRLYLCCQVNHQWHLVGEAAYAALHVRTFKVYCKENNLSQEKGYERFYKAATDGAGNMLRYPKQEIMQNLSQNFEHFCK